MGMRPVLLIDFGSTYTKVTAVDLQSARLLGTAASFTTVETDVGDGLQNALYELEKRAGKLDFLHRYACSSAAGGLRMVTSGLVPSLTAEAARTASLGAGAKVVGVYSYQLTEEDIEEIDSLRPDIFLLTGGVDGGNRDSIIHNARMLATCGGSFPILIAGNRTAAAQCEKLLAGRETFRCPNVMPRLGELNIGPVQEKIRELFLHRIIQAKGLSKAGELISGILMPTPSAMLAAMELLAKGTGTGQGLGELVAVDLGGATTDVYSIASGLPQNDNTVLKGLQEPYSKRTVEGDIGMRYSVTGILEAVGAARLAQLSGLEPEAVEALVKQISAAPGTLPDTPQLTALDEALACAAIETAVTRHAGRIEEVYTPMGLAYAQTGKDLTRVETLVLTGGAIIHNRRAGEIAAHALYSPAQPDSLKPRAADIYVDRPYILAAMGLLGQYHPETALSIMKAELETIPR